MLIIMKMVIVIVVAKICQWCSFECDMGKYISRSMNHCATFSHIARKMNNVSIFSHDQFTHLQIERVVECHMGCYRYTFLSEATAEYEKRRGLSFTVVFLFTAPLQVKIDGGWSSWTDWEQCSKECGTGYQSRYRLCNNPRPSRHGQPCVGNQDEWQNCNKDPCPGERNSVK